MVPEKQCTDKCVDKPVQERLLDAAEELFCEKGFDATSIRDIAAQANCNVASVNYYFGSKENLYVGIWRRHLIQMRESRLKSIESVMSSATQKDDLESILTSFANSFIGPLVDFEKECNFAKLMGREMLDGHLPGNLLFDELVKPTLESLGGALLEACPRLEPSSTPLVILSIIGQLMHALHFRIMMKDFHVEQELIFEMEEVIAHIVKFSSAGIRACCRENVE